MKTWKTRNCTSAFFTFFHIFLVNDDTFTYEFWLAQSNHSNNLRISGKILTLVQCLCSSEWIVEIFLCYLEQELLNKMVFSKYSGFISALIICSCSNEACDISFISSLHKYTGMSVMMWRTLKGIEIHLVF